MDTGSKNDGGQGGSEEAPAEEPLGLAATAFGNPFNPRPRASVPPEHQKAVELTYEARRELMEGWAEQARALFGQAATLEFQVLKSVATQPEQGLIAEFGARAAIQAGRFELARRLLRRGHASQASEPMQWALLRVSIQVDLLELVQGAFEGSWQVPWDDLADDEAETRILLVGRDGHRLVFDLDPEVSSVRKVAVSREELRFVIPAARPDRGARHTLEVSMTHWLQPRRRMQVVLDRRGLMEHLVPDFVPA